MARFTELLAYDAVQAHTSRNSWGSVISMADLGSLFDGSPMATIAEESTYIEQV